MTGIEYENIINFLDGKTSQPSKFRTKHWVEIKDDVHRIYSTEKLEENLRLQ